MTTCVTGASRLENFSSVTPASKSSTCTVSIHPCKARPRTTSGFATTAAKLSVLKRSVSPSQINFGVWFITLLHFSWVYVYLLRVQIHVKKACLLVVVRLVRDQDQTQAVACSCRYPTPKKKSRSHSRDHLLGGIRP